jgi:uncharacterized alpha-E superfamily protein
MVEPSAAILEPVLEIADSLMTYRRRYFTAPQWAGVLDLLLRDESNPRSLIFQINTLREHSAAFIVDPKSAPVGLSPDRIQSLAVALRSVVPDELAIRPAQGTLHPLLALLKRSAAELTELSDQVTNHYFSHSLPRLS